MPGAGSSSKSGAQQSSEIGETAAADAEMRDDEPLRTLPLSICHVCCNPVSSTEEYLECFGRCKQQVHTGCLDVPKQEIEVLRKNKNAVYVCDVCIELHGFDDRAKVEETMNEVATQIKKLQCVFDFVEKFDSKVRKIFREECGKIVTGKLKVENSENVLSGRVLRSAKKRKMTEQMENTATENSSIGAAMETPRSSAGGSFADAVKRDVTRVQHSAASVVTSGAEKMEKNKKPNPKLVIKAKEKNSATNLCKMLKEKVDRKSLSIQDVKTRQDGAVVVEVLNDDSMNELKDRVAKCMGDLCEIELPEAPKPTVKLMDLTDKWEEDDLKQALIQDNQILGDMSHFKLRRCYAMSKDEDSKYAAVFEVDAVTHRKILEKRRLLCDWDSCRVFDGLDVMRCYKCCGFNHKGAECKEDTETCPRCAGAHSVQKCESNELKCANCLKQKNNTACIEHAAWSEICPVYQSLKKKKKKQIDYTQ